MTNASSEFQQGNSRSPRVIAITGGKGGVGKTSIAINLAITLAKSGSKVCLLDADTGLANINIMLGIHPPYTLEHLFTGEKSIQDIVIEGPEGIHIIPGASGFAQCVELDFGQQQRLMSAIKLLEPHYDYFIVDTAAGISTTVLHFVAAAQVAAVVLTPEPTSLTDAFSLLKVMRRRGYKRKAQVIVNMTPTSSKAEKVFRRFSTAVAKYLGLRTEYLGSVWMDESMRTAVTLQRPVALFPKTDPSARSFYRIADRLEDVFSRPSVPRLPFSAYWQKLIERSVMRAQSEPAMLVEPQRTEKPQPLEKPQPEARSSAEQENQLRSQAQSELDRASTDGAETDDVITVESGGKPELPNKEQKPDLKVAVSNDKNASLVQPAEVEEQRLELLSSESEEHWIKLRGDLNRFVGDDRTTPEQVSTLLSSCIHSYGDRFGEAAIDLLQGMLAAIGDDTLSDSDRQRLAPDLARLGFDLKPNPAGSNVHNIRETDDSKESYDFKGFGNQQALADQIRASSGRVPLESLLESIKYASLVDQEDE